LKIFGRLYCRHVTAGSAAAEGRAASLFLEVCGSSFELGAHWLHCWMILLLCISLMKKSKKVKLS